MHCETNSLATDKDAAAVPLQDDSILAPAVKRRRASNSNAVPVFQENSGNLYLFHKQSQGSTSAKTALYLFAGVKRKSTIGDMLGRKGWTVLEVDILQSKRHDLTRTHNQEAILEQIKKNKFDLVISSPPCDSFTRVKYANKFGPPPSRSKAHPRGIPGLPQHLAKLNRLGNILADFSFTAILAQLGNPSGRNFVIKEHPEDLGVVQSGPYKGKFPASIWQFPQFQQCLDAGAKSVGLRQSDYGMPYAKPTRLLLKLPGQMPKTFFEGLPKFNDAGEYTGPIPRSVNHTSTLAKTHSAESFRTTGTAAWPPLLCKELVRLVTSTPSGSPEQSSAVVSRGAPWLAEGKFTAKASTSNESFPIDEPPLNYNQGGTGEPRTILSTGKLYAFHDGAGLCSPGRWDKQFRTFPTDKRWVLLRDELERETIGKLDEGETTKQLLALCCGKDYLFRNDWLPKIRNVLHRWLSRQSGDYPTEKGLTITDGQPFYLFLLEYILREGGDPDYKVMQKYREGVNLGVTEALPHTPAVFELQETWRLKDSPLEYPHWYNRNYASLEEHRDKIREQLEEDEKEGLMKRTTLGKLKETYGNDFAISALSALKEKDKVRLLHDGSNITRVNHRIKTRDKLRCPGPREKAYLLNDYRNKGEIGMSLLGDVGKAHRRIKIRQKDWGWQACTLADLTDTNGDSVDDKEVWLNTVGTFGLSSAAYWWGRLGAALIRAMYLLLGPGRPLDALLYADDLELIAENKSERPSILLGVIYLMALGVPLKWSKFRGGYSLDWVGFSFCHKSYAIGLSTDRAAWVISWVSQILKEGRISGADFSAGLGRLNFAALALIHERPFLGLLYAWSAVIGHSATQFFKIPWACQICLFWFSRRVQQENGRLQQASTISRPLSDLSQIELFRSDAKATESGGWIGGWEYLGGQDPSKARWWAFQVDAGIFPWLFVKKDPKRIIAALEMLATIICIMVFPREGNVIGCFTGGTDNQSNTHSVKKLLSTKYPLTILLMELSEQLRLRNSSLNLRWVPRELNQEADDLTNNRFDRFHEDLRIPIIQEDLDFLVLKDINKAAGDLFAEICEKKKNKEPKTKIRKTKVTDRLKWRSPW